MPLPKVEKPVQEREVFIVGRAAFLSLFCFFFLLIFYYYAKRSFADIDGVFVAGFGKGVFF